MDRATPPDATAGLAARIAAATGDRLAWSAPVRGGYTPAIRRRVRLARLGPAFAKLATDEATAAALRLEHFVLSGVAAPFLPRVLAWDGGGERPLLVLEDLGAARWPPPWRAGDLDALLVTLDALASIAPPPGVPALGGGRPPESDWARIAADPEPFLALGVGSRRWLERVLPDLIAAELAFDLGGDALVHGDIYSGNLCHAERGPILVDWGCARRGNPAFDRGMLLVSAKAEGVSLPDLLLPDARLAAVMSGIAAYGATLPPFAPGTSIRAQQLNDLRTASLPWALAALDLPPPDGPSPSFT